jgi:hypothetical protein
MYFYEKYLLLAIFGLMYKINAQNKYINLHNT